MGGHERPLPRINEDNRAFWEGCRRHEMRFQRCEACGRVRWPASALCPQCHSWETGFITARGRGKVYTFAVYHVAYHPAFEKDLPYVVADVELEEGPRFLTRLVGCRPEEVTCDMPVEVFWEDLSEEISLPAFKPIAAQGSQVEAAGEASPSRHP